MNYTTVIRTLGKAGVKYQQTLDSLCHQTIQPEEILIYIAEGYDIPKETCGMERYIYVKKGMVAQRALPFDEVKTEWILFLDDDVYLPEDGVELMFRSIKDHGVDVVAPNTFDNHLTSGNARILGILLGKMVPFKSDEWAYRVLPSGGFGYNANPTKDFYRSESNAGPCFLCRKKDFLDIHLEDELWLDMTPYALPDDQVIFYKMHINGLKIGTLYGSGIKHLDAGTSVGMTVDKAEKILYSEVKNQIIFWHRFIRPYRRGLRRIVAWLAINRYKNGRRLLALKNAVSGNTSQLRIVNQAIRDAKNFNKQQ